MNLSFLETLGLKNTRLRLIVSIITAAFLIYRFVPGLFRIPNLRLIDLFVQYVAARVLAVRGNIYSFDQLRAMADQIGGVRYGTAFSDLLLGYTHPPSDTFFDLRWTLLDWTQVKFAYAVITPLLYFAALVLIWLTLKPMAPRVLHWVFPAALFAFFVPTGSSLGLGQSDIPIFFLIVASFWAASRGRDFVAGLALAIAILMKLSPAVFLLYWAWKREWRILIYTSATVAALCLASLPFVGLDLWIQFITQIFPAISTGTSYAQNQSLPGLIARLMLPPSLAEGLQSAPSVPIVRLTTYLATAIVVGLALYFTRRRLASRTSLQFALEYSVWVIVAVVISPIAWDHYFTWLLLPLTVFLAAMLNSTLTPLRSSLLFVTYIASWLLLNISSNVIFKYPPGWQRAPLLYGGLLLLALLFERLEFLQPQAQVEPAATLSASQLAPKNE